MRLKTSGYKKLSTKFSWLCPKLEARSQTIRSMHFEAQLYAQCAVQTGQKPSRTEAHRNLSPAVAPNGEYINANKEIDVDLLILNPAIIKAV